jgi:hypothetical protein
MGHTSYVRISYLNISQSEVFCTPFARRGGRRGCDASPPKRTVIEDKREVTA